MLHKRAACKQWRLAKHAFCVDLQDFPPVPRNLNFNQDLVSAFKFKHTILTHIVEICIFFPSNTGFVQRRFLKIFNYITVLSYENKSIQVAY